MDSHSAHCPDTTKSLEFQEHFVNLPALPAEKRHLSVTSVWICLVIERLAILSSHP